MSGPGLRRPRCLLGAGSQARRRVWEREYEERVALEAPWAIAEPPPELVRLVEAGTVPPGPSVDLGCGAGVMTAYLSGHFRPTLGVDIALSAIRHARAFAAQRGRHPSFAVAEVPFLPLRERSFAFVFDRGCLQAVPRGRWRAYFAEVERILRPGGVLQLYCLKTRDFPRLLSPRGVLARLRYYLLRRGGFLSRSRLARLLPPSLEALTVEEIPFLLKTGRVVLFTHGVFRRR